MSGLYKRHNTSSDTTVLTTVQVSTSIYGSVIPVVYGTTRIASNMVDYDDFQTHANTQKSGKGGGSSSTSYTYSASVICALCHGPIKSIGTVWLDKDTYTLASTGFTMLPGTRPQSPWATWTSEHPAKAIGYSGIALVCCQNVDMGSNASMKNFNWEVGGGSGGASVSVPGTTLPWDPVANPSYPFTDYSGGTAPVVLACAAGTTLTLSATGLITYNPALATVGPAGMARDATTQTKILPTNFSGATSSTPDFGCLVGAWMNASGLVMGVISIMAGGTWTVPSGAVSLQLGINDWGSGDNGGAYSVQVTQGLTGSADALPAPVATDILTNPYYGAGWTAGIGDLSGWATYCAAMGFAVSPAYTDQTTAADALQLILDATHSDLYLHASSTGMQLQIQAYVEAPVAGNGSSYIPVTAPLYDLGEDDFLGVVGADGTPTGDDRITITRSSTTDVCNSVPVEYWQRADSYNVHTEEVPEIADVTQNGYKPDSSLSLHLITNQQHAQTISALRARRNVYVRNSYAFKIGWKYQLLEPMVDLVTLTDHALGMDHRIVRIVSIEVPEETSEEEGMSVVAEDWPFGTGSATAYPSSSGTAYTGSTSAPVTSSTPALNNTTATTGTSSSAVNTAADPGPIATPVIFEPPALLSGSSSPEIWIGAAGLGQYWGGCNILLSTDGGTSYSQVGQIASPARFGALTTALPLAADPDNTDTLAVSLVASGGTLSGTNASGLAAWATAALVDSEIVAFETATLTGTDAYNLTTLRRGGYGSAVAAHASGASFLRLDEAIAKQDYSSSLIGTTMYFKFQSFNLWGSGLEAISGLTAYPYVPTGASQYPQPTAVTVVESASQPTPAAGVEYRLIDTWQDGIAYNGGAPLALQKIWLNIAWTFPSSAANPEDFDVVLFAGSDPTNPETYVREPIRVDGTVRQLVIAVASSAAASVNAAVRSHYA